MGVQGGGYGQEAALSGADNHQACGPQATSDIQPDIGKMRNEFLSGEVLDTLEATKVIVETWPRVYNRIRPYNSFGKRPPEPKAHVVGKVTLGLVPY